MLPHDEFVLLQVLNVVQWRNWLELEHEPAHMGPEEALGDVIGVLVGIDVLVVLAVLGAPPQGGILKGGGPKEQNEDLYGPLGPIGLVGEKPVVSHSDADAGGRIEEKKNSEKEPVPSIVP